MRFSVTKKIVKTPHRAPSKIYKINEHHKIVKGYAMIGEQVVKSGNLYAPGYDKAGHVTNNTVSILIKETNKIIHLHVTFGNYHAVVDWFYKTPENKNNVLCFDTGSEQEFYVEERKQELCIFLNQQGKECVADEAHILQYRTDLHDNAIIVYGE